MELRLESFASETHLQSSSASRQTSRQNQVAPTNSSIIFNFGNLRIFVPTALIAAYVIYCIIEASRVEKTVTFYSDCAEDSSRCDGIENYVFLPIVEVVALALCVILGLIQAFCACLGIVSGKGFGACLFLGVFATIPIGNEAYSLYDEIQSDRMQLTQGRTDSAFLYSAIWHARGHKAAGIAEAVIFGLVMIGMTIALIKNIQNAFSRSSSQIVTHQRDLERSRHPYPSVISGPQPWSQQRENIKISELDEKTALLPASTSFSWEPTPDYIKSTF